MFIFGLKIQIWILVKKGTLNLWSRTKQVILYTVKWYLVVKKAPDTNPIANANMSIILQVRLRIMI